MGCLYRAEAEDNSGASGMLLTEVLHSVAICNFDSVTRLSFVEAHQGRLTPILQLLMYIRQRGNFELSRKFLELLALHREVLDLPELDWGFWRFSSSSSSDIQLRGVLSSSIFTTLKHIDGVNN